MDTVIWTLLYGHCYMDTAIRTLLYGHCYMDTAIQTLLYGQCYMDTVIWTLLSLHSKIIDLCTLFEMLFTLRKRFYYKNIIRVLFQQQSNKYCFSIIQRTTMLIK